MELADLGDETRRMTEASPRLRVLLGPAGSAGDVHPFVGLGKALQARGHEVIVATSPYFQDLIGRAGLRFEPIGTVETLTAAMENPDLWHPRRGFRVLFDAIGPMIREAYAKTAELVEPQRTVIVGQWLALGTRLAAERLGVPMATVHLQPAAFISPQHLREPATLRADRWPLPMRRMLVRGLDWAADRMLAEWVTPLCAEVGLPRMRRAVTGWGLSPDRVIGLFPDWYGPPQPDWPLQTRLTGFPLYDEGGETGMPEEVEEFLAAGSPPIAFTPGSACLFGGAFLEAGAEACARLGRRGILLTRHLEQLPHELPEGVRHFEYVPFGKLLPRCAALVHHGGIGTTAQGLAAGIPHLVMPMTFDQPDNARRLRELGVGASLPPKRFRGPAVAEALRELLGSREVAPRCREIAKCVRASEAIGPTCRLIEELGGKADEIRGDEHQHDRLPGCPDGRTHMRRAADAAGR